jgi:hypothetical protein
VHERVRARVCAVFIDERTHIPHTHARAHTRTHHLAAGLRGGDPGLGQEVSDVHHSRVNARTHTPTHTHTHTHTPMDNLTQHALLCAYNVRSLSNSLLIPPSINPSLHPSLFASLTQAHTSEELSGFPRNASIALRPCRACLSVVCVNVCMPSIYLTVSTLSLLPGTSRSPCDPVVCVCVCARACMLACERTCICVRACVRARAWCV